MMRSTFYWLTIIGISSFAPLWLTAQSGLVLQVDSATINLTCGDLIGSPEPMWGVNVNGEGYQYYPQDGPCFSALPNQQFTATGSCPGDLPAMVEVCFHGFENDPTFPPPISCAISPDCEATICHTFSIPAVGQAQSFQLDLPAGGDVTGSLFFTMAVQSLSPAATNDHICDAIDLGTLAFNTSLGDLISPIYNNYCATNSQEPNPFDLMMPGVFINDQGVWFTFQTGPNPSGVLLLDVRSDPLKTGDEFDAQIAVYEFTGGDCTGTPTLVASNSDNSQFNVRLPFQCAKPNTTYHVLVDGGTFGNESIEGPFSLRIIDPGVIEGGDLRCDFEDLGVVEENGIVETAGFRSNYCADSFQDPFVAAFVSQHSVWFSFIAPPSGHVYIEALSDQIIEPLDAQLAVYWAISGACNGGLRHIQSQYIDGNPDEMMEVSCLYGGDRYFVLVDGSGTRPQGVFKISVSDAGDITPTTVVDTILCAGKSLRVGSSVYTTSGNYIDTLRVKDGCDSIVMTNLTVAEPLVVNFQQTKFAFGEGAADAAASVSVSGGIGTARITWCDGQTGPTATGLVGGSECCVTVADAAGCIFYECYEIGFVTGVIPVYRDTSVACKGDRNGVITLSAYSGLPPYLYNWMSADGSLSGTGSIEADYQEVQISGLPAGQYTFNIADSFRDSTFTVIVNEPPRLVGQVSEKRNITCVDACDGVISIQVTGGTLPYQMDWSDGSTGLMQLSRLCAGSYQVTVTDANGCQITLGDSLEAPPPFTAETSVVQEVSCYGGTNGRIGVNVSNGTAATYRWSNGATTQVQSNLPAGFYQVTVTSDLFCEAAAAIELTQPAGPLEVDIETLSNISCGGETDGVLQAVVEGTYQDLTYQWSNGQHQPIATALAPGWHQIRIRNERGCTAQDSFLLEEPPLIEALLSTRDITCLDPPSSGVIFIEQVSGGQGGYRYSIDGDRFSTSPAIRDLNGGEYELIVQDQSGCERQFPVTIQSPPDLEVSFGEQVIELDLGDSILLEAVASSNTVSYRWAHDSSLSSASTTIAPQVSTLYRVEAEDTETNCRAEATVFVQVNKLRRVYIPNAFSPNMDGNNDYFYIYADNDVVSIESFQVFSREGQLLFQDGGFLPNDPLHSWDGTLNGRELNSGVYIYAAKIRFVDGLVEIFKGDVALVR